jgi:hypothetical protein
MRRRLPRIPLQLSIRADEGYQSSAIPAFYIDRAHLAGLSDKDLRRWDCTCFFSLSLSVSILFILRCHNAVRNLCSRLAQPISRLPRARPTSSEWSRPSLQKGVLEIALAFHMVSFVVVLIFHHCFPIQ